MQILEGKIDMIHSNQLSSPAVFPRGPPPAFLFGALIPHRRSLQYIDFQAAACCSWKPGALYLLEYT